MMRPEYGYAMKDCKVNIGLTLHISSSLLSHLSSAGLMKARSDAWVRACESGSVHVKADLLTDASLLRRPLFQEKTHMRRAQHLFE